MAFQISKEHGLKLEALHSEARFKHRHKDGQDVVICLIRDKYLGNDWAKGEAIGSDAAAEEAALTDALNKAQPGDRPLTNAELAADNAKLRAELAAARGEKPDSGPVEVKREEPAPAPTPAADSGAEAEGEAVDLNDLSTNEIIQLLDAKGLKVPEGDRRTLKWREEAARLLQN